MPIAITAKIIGMDPLIRKLRILPEEAIAKIRVAMAKEADEIVALMRRLAPEDSGDLRKSIGWTWGNKAPKGAIAIATKGKGGLSITVYAGGKDAYYARFVEWGTAPHIAGGKYAGAEHPGTKAQPFFYPGWRARRNRPRQQFARHLVMPRGRWLRDEPVA